MRCTDLVAIATTAAWGFLAAAGTEALTDLGALRVPGPPAQTQSVLYVGMPVSFLASTLGAAVLSRKARWFRTTYPLAVGVIAIALMPTGRIEMRSPTLKVAPRRITK